eukprot:scaffold215823_cov41-Prasinocladus_malaysianus.AAC.1
MRSRLIYYIHMHVTVEPERLLSSRLCLRYGWTGRPSTRSAGGSSRSLGAATRSMPCARPSRSSSRSPRGPRAAHRGRQAGQQTETMLMLRGWCT